VNDEGTAVEKVVNLGWTERVEMGVLAPRLGVAQILCANDANAGAYGEYAQGAGKGKESDLFSTCSAYY
jgi:predicted NBD/HSP70 family sugar kinase